MSNQIVNEIKNKYPKLEVEYFPRKGKVTVYGFHSLDNAQKARTELEAMGFQLGPNNGVLEVEAVFEDVNFEEMSESQIRASQDYWSR